LRLGNDDHCLEAHRGTHQRQPDPGVAGGAFDDGAAGFQKPLFHRILDDVERGAVLDRLAGVHEFRLAQDGAAGFLGRLAQLDEGRVPDGVGKVLANGHGGPFVNCVSQV